MVYKEHIFDVGAFNGLDGLILALNNSNMLVHIFEANPEMIKIIKKNKKKIENFKKLKINNLIINNLVVSDRNKYFNFNIAKNPTVSSLYSFSKNIDKTWPGYREAHCTFVKKIKIKGITLDDYCKKNKINSIKYLHIDTQGNDLKVLKGLNKKIQIVEKGVLEAAVSESKSLYQNNNTIKDIKKFLKKKNFSIERIEPVDKNIKNEKNVYFFNNDINSKKQVNSKYKLRHFNRIISDKTNLKDNILNKFEQILKIKTF